jgi:hypothetical protein
LLGGPSLAFLYILMHLLEAGFELLDFLFFIGYNILETLVDLTSEIIFYSLYLTLQLDY